MAWLWLVIAGLFEIGWVIGLKYSEGFTRLVPSIATAVSMLISLGLLGIAMKTLPMSTAYAVWTGIGSAGTALLGILVLGDPSSAGRLACIGLIVGGVVGLKLLE